MRILDTDFIADILRKREKAISKFEELKASEEPFATTIFNAQEILFGALLTEKSQENFKIAEDLLGSLELFQYDYESVVKSVEIQADLEKKGLHIGIIDEMIAGICLHRNAAIVTRNVKHFSRIQKLKVESC